MGSFLDTVCNSSVTPTQLSARAHSDQVVIFREPKSQYRNGLGRKCSEHRCTATRTVATHKQQQQHINTIISNILFQIITDILDFTSVDGCNITPKHDNFTRTAAQA